MIFVADEGVDKPIVDALRNNGYNIYYIVEFEPGISDEEVLKIANQHKAVLITLDKDFGELVVRRRQANAGVILLRLNGLTKDDKIKIVLEALTKHDDELLHSFTVITDKQVRIRSLR